MPDESLHGHPSSQFSIMSHLHRTTWWIAALVLWGAWNGQTDCYPFNESQARPSWYVYGWPICFGTSGRGRLNFDSFAMTALVVALVLALMIVACTVFAAELLRRHAPRFTISDMLAITVGVSVVVAFWTGGLYCLWQKAFGAVLPPPDWSATAGNAQPMGRLSPLITFPLSVGLTSVGFTIFALPLAWINSRRGQRRTGCA